LIQQLLDGPVSDGDAVTLDETGGDAVSWSWTGPDGFMSTDQAPVIDPAVAGDYTVEITDVNGCSSLCMTTVEVFEPITPYLVMMVYLQAQL